MANVILLKRRENDPSSVTMRPEKYNIIHINYLKQCLVEFCYYYEYEVLN